MKLDTLYESYDSDEEDEKEGKQNDIIDWCSKNLYDFGRSNHDFEIDDNFVIHTPIVKINTKIKSFPYKFTDVEELRIQYIDILESFDNFPTSGNASDIRYDFSNTGGDSKKSHLDFSKLPVSEDVDSVTFAFYNVDYVTTRMLCGLHHNIETIAFNFCDSPDLYDFEKYTLYVQDFKIYPKRRFKNLGSFLREEIDYYSFIIYSFTSMNQHLTTYTGKQIKFLNDMFMRYHGKYDHTMDFVVELIDNGFEDEV